MNTIERLNEILKRFDTCPFYLFRVNLDLFLHTLSTDVSMSTLLDSVCREHETVLGAKALSFLNIQTSQWTQLEEFNTTSLMAAFCYRLCQCLIDEKNPIVCGKKADAIGRYYRGQLEVGVQQNYEPPIKLFSKLFMQPILYYLNGVIEKRHRILILMSKYRQRSEWFMEKETISKLRDNSQNLESELKKNFLLYLFDNGIDFSIESEYPPGGGEVDILATIPEFGYIPVEVKVFDGVNRNNKYVFDGLYQTRDYANKFNCSEGYYIVYNVKQDTELVIPGVLILPNVVKTVMHPVTIYSITVNIVRTLPASQAIKLNRIEISTPT